MKIKNISRNILLLLILAPLFLSAQDQRLTKTKVADALALLPATDNQQAARIFQDLINLGDEGLQLVTEGVQPNGIVEGIPSRYAVSLLTHYATTKEQKAKIERAYLATLKKSTNTEVKAYFMDNLKVVGSNESVPVLKEYISDKESYDPAISTLVRIGSEDASKALMNALPNQQVSTQVRLIKALGELNYQPALASITAFASSENALLKKQALWTIAQIADASSYQVLLQQAKNVGFKNDPTEATTALVEYLHQMTSKGNSALVKEISKALVDNTADASQQHFRLAGLKGLAQVDPQGSVATLIKERSRFDAEYQKEILKIAVTSAGSPAALKLWQKEYKKSNGSSQADILSMLAKANRNDGFVETMLVPALSSSNPQTRMAAASEIASYRNKKFAPILLDYLLKSTEDTELSAAKEALLQLADKNTDILITQKFETAQSKGKVALLQILGARRAVDHFAIIAKQTSSGDAAVKDAAYNALPNVSSASNVSELLKMLSVSENDKELKAIQSAIISAVDKNAVALINTAYPTQKVRLLPVMPYLNDSGALEKVVTAFYHGSEKEKQVAFDALRNWQDSEAIRTLLTIRKDANLKQYHAQALQSFVSQVGKSSWPDDQKLLMLREMMTLASGRNEKSTIIRAAGNVRTFLSLMFVADYLDDQELSSAASRATMQIALPTSDAKPG